MPRLLGIEIPSNKKIEYALRYIYGIGPYRAKYILEKINIDPSTRSHELNEEQLNQIVEQITQEGFLTEGDLRREVSANLKRLIAVRSYRGLRHQRGLPVRGQRTRTNARTRKGGKKRVGALAKK